MDIRALAVNFVSDLVFEFNSTRLSARHAGEGLPSASASPGLLLDEAVRMVRPCNNNVPDHFH